MYDLRILFLSFGQEAERETTLLALKVVYSQEFTTTEVEFTGSDIYAGKSTRSRSRDVFDEINLRLRDA